MSDLTFSDLTFTRRTVRIEVFVVRIRYRNDRNRARTLRFMRRSPGIGPEEARQIAQSHYAGVMVRWLARTMARRFPTAEAVDGPQVEWTEIGDDWIRNEGHVQASVRAIPDAPEQLRGIRVARGVSVVEYLA